MADFDLIEMSTWSVWFGFLSVPLCMRTCYDIESSYDVEYLDYSQPSFHAASVHYDHLGGAVVRPYPAKTAGI